MLPRVEMTKESMLTLKIKNEMMLLFNAMIKNESRLLYLRFGYLNFNGLNLSYKKNTMKCSL